MKTFILSFVFLASSFFTNNYAPQKIDNQLQNSKIIKRDVDCFEVAKSYYDFMVTVGYPVPIALNEALKLQSECEEGTNL